MRNKLLPVKQFILVMRLLCPKTVSDADHTQLQDPERSAIKGTSGKQENVRSSLNNVFVIYVYIAFLWLYITDAGYFLYPDNLKDYIKQLPGSCVRSRSQSGVNSGVFCGNTKYILKCSLSPNSHDYFSPFYLNMQITTNIV